MWLAIWLAGVAIAGIIVGVFVGFRAASRSLQSAVHEFNRNSVSDRNFALSVLRRELANWMFRRDPDRYLRIYEKLHEEGMVISAVNKSDNEAQLARLTEKYAFYNDFDLLGTRDYVLYADAMSTNLFDEVESRYIDIIRFQGLNVALHQDWANAYPKVNTTSKDELAHLKEYVQQFKDMRFEYKIKDAVGKYHSYQADIPKKPEYETDMFSVRRVPHFAEIRYGIQFKDTDEFGLYTVFYSDREEPYVSVYRSDPSFEKEIVLHAILIDEPSLALG